jgi:hypothetical protein
MQQEEASIFCRAKKESGMKFLKLFAPVLFMLLVLIALVVAFNYPEQEIKRTVIDLAAFEIVKAGDL